MQLDANASHIKGHEMKQKTILRPLSAVPQFTYGLRPEFTPDGQKSAEASDLGCLDAPMFMACGSMYRYELTKHAWAVPTEFMRGTL